MKGKLQKTEQGWVVIYEKKQKVGLFGASTVWIDKQLPLHPTDVEQINKDAIVFDNIEARIAAHPYIDFEIIPENVDIGGLEAPYIKIDFAKLKL